MTVQTYEGLIAETVQFPGHNGENVSGYVARPLGAGPFPGVIVIHEVFGLTPDIKEMARRFATEGYIAVTPDLYTREAFSTFTDISEVRAAIQAIGGFPDERFIGDLEGTATYLKSLPTCSGKLGCIGYCSGGRNALLFACNTNSLSAAVNCYGGRVVDEPTPTAPVPVIQMVKDLSCPLLGLFGKEDGNPSPEHVAILEDELRKHGKTHELHSYDNAGHAFFAAHRPSYRQEAAVDGWQKVFDFFGKHLKVQEAARV
jgi:carboxymethylenebutenolidase